MSVDGATVRGNANEKVQNGWQGDKVSKANSDIEQANTADQQRQRQTFFFFI